MLKHGWQTAAKCTCDGSSEDDLGACSSRKESTRAISAASRGELMQHRSDNQRVHVARKGRSASSACTASCAGSRSVAASLCLWPGTPLMYCSKYRNEQTAHSLILPIPTCPGLPRPRYAAAPDARVPATPRSMPARAAACAPAPQRTGQRHGQPDRRVDELRDGTLNGTGDLQTLGLPSARANTARIQS